MGGLDGIRVVELAAGVGLAWAAKLLADLGADVVRLEGDADVVRSRPHGVHRWLNTNKRAMSDTAERRRKLLPGADIVLHGLPAARARDEGVDFGRLSADSPALVVCSLTPWGATGPYADHAAEELTLIHASSWGYLSPSAATDAELPPLKAPGHHASINVATEAATAALAAFDRAERTGVGEHVDVSMFAAAAKMTEFAPATVSFLGFDPSRLGTKSVVPWGTYECRDGLIQVTCPEENQWQSLVELMGHPEWATLDVLATAEGRRRNPDLVDIYLAEWFADQRLLDVYHEGQRRGVGLTPVNTMSQLATDDHLAARGFFAPTPDGDVLPGPVGTFDQPWWELRRPAPDPGQHDGETWTPRPAGRPAPTPIPDSAVTPTPGQRPLDGVRICDFTWVWAGPFCTQVLAHLGADVVRLESPDRPDIFRRMPFTPKGVTRTLDTAGPFQLYNSDKRSVAVDLRHPDARALVLRLVERSDVVVDNFSVGTMAELGFGIDDLRRGNPEVIVASLSGYGQSGPRSGYTAYGPAGGAMAGLYAANGYADGGVAETGIAVGDPGLGLAAAWSIVAALVARRRTGQPAVIDAAMVEAVAATTGELWMEYVATGHDPPRRGNHDVAWAPHNCYPAAGDDTWVTIACTTEASWRGLCTVIDPTLADDPRFADAGQRKRHEDELDELIARWTSGLDRGEVTSRLQAAGVAAFGSVSPAELWGGDGDPQLGAIGMLERPDHPATGRRTVPGIPWRLTNGPNGLRRPAPTLGQHTDEVLSDVLGYSPDEIADLRRRGVVPATPDPPVW